MAYSLKDMLELSMGVQVALMNSLFTRKMGDAPAGSKNAINQHDYTVSEWEETKDALRHGYVSDELRDGIADMFTTIIGSLWRSGDNQTNIFHIKGVKWLGTESNLNTAEAKQALESIGSLVDSITEKLPTMTNEDFQSLLNELLEELFNFACGIGIDPHADLSQVTLANISKLCQSQDALDRTYEKYKAIGVELYHEEVEPGVFAVFSKGTQLGTDGKTYDADKFLKSADWFEPFFPSLTKDSALASANVSASLIQATPKIDLVDEKGNPLI